MVSSCQRSEKVFVWFRLTATTADRFFRIDRALEPAHYVTDIASRDLYIVDPDLHTSFLAPAIVYGSDVDDVPVAAVAAGSSWLLRPSLVATSSAVESNSIHYRRYGNFCVAIR